MAKRLVVLKAGQTAPPLRRLAGDYDRWFAEALGGTGARLDVVQAHLGQRLPAPERLSGVLMTGSPLSVTQPAQWMGAAAQWMLRAAERGVPVLGVCFGHQLLGEALGAKVIKNPRGREIGTIAVQLTVEGAQDPLFAGLPTALLVQATHEDIVDRLPRGARRLAHNDFAGLQAFRAGRLWGVQFHPELAPSAMAALIRSRAERLDSEGHARGELPGERVRRLLAGIVPAPHGAKILRNFVERVCRPV